jgi:hypothetical protein
MKKKQIIVQERCLACGNGSPALPPARVDPPLPFPFFAIQAAF